MKVRVAARTDIGRARQRNEDAYLVHEPLFAVADGMGGHRGGDVASSMALESLSIPEQDSADTSAALVEDIKEANRRVLERGEAERDLRGMGTTLTAVVTEGEKAYLAHVGDSRAYLLRDGSLQQLTEDHTLVQRMVREGRLTPEEAAHHPQRSIITRALGVEDEVPVDQLTLDIHAGDRLLLCTDGLTGAVSKQRIQEVLEQEADPDRAVERLVEEANQAGGDDNITVVLLDFHDDQAVGEDEGSGRTVAVVPDRSPPSSSRDAAPRQEGFPRGEPLTAVMSAVPAPAGAVAEPGAPSKEEAPSPPSPAPPRRIRWKRVLLWVAVAIVLVVGVLVGGRAYIDRQWYVGVSSGRVAIYNGIPTKALGYRLSHVEETTDIDAASAERLQPYRDLAGGITARSLNDARTIVARIRGDLATQPGGTG